MSSLRNLLHLAKYILLTVSVTQAQDKPVDVCKVIKTSISKNVYLRSLQLQEMDYRDIIAKAPDSNTFYVNAARRSAHDQPEYSDGIAGWIKGSEFTQFIPSLNTTFSPVITWIAASNNPFALFASVNFPNYQSRTDPGFAIAYAPYDHQHCVLEGQALDRTLSGAKVSNNGRYIVFSYDYSSQNENLLGAVFEGTGIDRRIIGELNLDNASHYMQEQGYEAFLASTLGISDQGNAVLVSLQFMKDGEHLRVPGLFLNEANDYQLHILPFQGRAVGISSDGRRIQYIAPNKKILSVTVREALKNPKQTAIRQTEIATFNSYMDDYTDCDFQTSPELSMGFSVCLSYPEGKRTMSSAVWFSTGRTSLPFTQYMSKNRKQPLFKELDESGNLISFIEWATGAVYGRRTIQTGQTEPEGNFFACDPAYSNQSDN